MSGTVGIPSVHGPEDVKTSIYFPGPRDGLDEGSLAELAQDCRDIELDVAAPRPWVASRFAEIDVPDNASALVDGLAAYIEGLTASDV